MDPISAFIASLDPVAVPLGGIVTFTIFALLRGWLVPGGVVRDRIKDKQDQIDALSKERDDWKLAAQNEASARQIVVQQNTDLINAAETTNRLMESMRSYIERIDPANKPPAASSTQQREIESN